VQHGLLFCFCSGSGSAGTVPLSRLPASNAFQAERCLAQKWMPFLAAPYQQDDRSTPQRSPFSLAAWHGPRSYSGIPRGPAVFVDKL
tara:strand:- start:224 stop:484 length:261 start_codon:yes stop_codon:yes gene_type:complete